MSHPDLSLTEWIVLGLIAEHPSHGFAVAALTGPGGELGRYWYVSQPMVYRSISRLVERGLLVSVGSQESDRGPQRTLIDITDEARVAVDQWLEEPVENLRDVRSDLIMKVALLMRRGKTPESLFAKQRPIFEHIEEAFGDKAESDDLFRKALFSWRLEHARVSTRLLEDLEAAVRANLAITAE